MCIIIAKYKNKKTIPTIKKLKNCFNNNPDGAGFMYVDNHNVVIDKGYMTEDAFIKHYKKLCQKYNNFKNKSLVIHCRIGTSSGNTPANTHPYAITNKEKIIFNKYVTSKIGIAHNGIISNYNPKETHPTTNDTQNFIIRYLYPLYKNYKDFYKNKYIKDGIQNITNSKFAILDNNDNLYLIGDFTNDNGVNYSNTTYKHNWYNYSLQDYDYDYEYSWNNYKNKTKKYNNTYSDYFDEIYDDTTYNKNDDTITRDFYDNDLIPVQDDDFLHHLDNNDFYCACEEGDDLYYNPETLELFEYDKKTEQYIKLYDDVILYDKNCLKVL